MSENNLRIENYTDISKVFVEKVIKNINSNLELVDYEAYSGTKLGDNSMGILISLKINAKSKINGEILTKEIMAKFKPTGEWRENITKGGDTFGKEKKMYAHVFEDFENFQRDKNIPENEIYHPAPFYYKETLEWHENYILMDNLKVQGYIMEDRNKGLNYEKCLYAIKRLARFHAISFAMFEGNFEKIQEKYSFLKELWIQNPYDELKAEEFFRQIVMPSMNVLGHGLKKCPEYEKEAEIFENTFLGEESINNIMFKLYQLINLPVEHAVINHGDFYMNNILFKHDKYGNIKDDKIVDFQVARAGGRSLDILYFIYSSIQMSDLNKKEDEILTSYLEEFKSFAIKLGCCPIKHADAFNFNVLKEEMNRNRIYGVLMGFVFGFYMSTEKAPDMNDTRDMIDILKDMISEKGIAKAVDLIRNHLVNCK